MKVDHLSYIKWVTTFPRYVSILPPFACLAIQQGITFLDKNYDLCTPNSHLMASAKKKNKYCRGSHSLSLGISEGSSDISFIPNPHRFTTSILAKLMQTAEQNISANLYSFIPKSLKNQGAAQQIIFLSFTKSKKDLLLWSV